MPSSGFQDTPQFSVVSEQDGPRMTGIANFKGKKAKHYGKPDAKAKAGAARLAAMRQGAKNVVAAARGK